MEKFYTNTDKTKGETMIQEYLIVEWVDITPRDLAQLEREGYDAIVSKGKIYAKRG